MDCEEYMTTVPDNAFDLVIADPPYGIKMSEKTSYWPNAITTYKKKKWDNNIPGEKYFTELFRVSKNQIIWGGNYFTRFLPPQPKWIVWDKKQPEGIDQAMFELAWNSQQDKQAMIYRQSIASTNNRISNNRKLAAAKKTRVHQTQKPVALYKWLLKNYANPGDKIFDSHGGSMTHAIACDQMGFDLTICEIDEDHFNDGKKLFTAHKKQLNIFS